MTGATIHSEISDRTSVPPADVRVATSSAVSPKAAVEVATLNSVVAKNGRGAPAHVGQPSLGASSLDLPAASSGVAGLSFEDEVSALEFAGVFACSVFGACPRVSIKNVTTFAVAAASETISNSTSSVGA